MADYEHITKNDAGEEIVVSFRVTSWGSLPQISGPPESCHDGDPMEIEITSAVSEDYLESIVLTESELSRIENEIYMDPPEYDDFPDFSDEIPHED